jgi:hypothetical protein
LTQLPGNDDDLIRCSIKHVILEVTEFDYKFDLLRKTEEQWWKNRDPLVGHNPQNEKSPSNWHEDDHWQTTEYQWHNDGYFKELEIVESKQDSGDQTKLASGEFAKWQILYEELLGKSETHGKDAGTWRIPLHPGAQNSERVWPSPPPVYEAISYMWGPEGARRVYYHR